ETNSIKYEPTDVLRIWTEENRQWLSLSAVYRKTTDNIRVTVIPFYMGQSQDHAHSFYWWRYCTRLENLSKEISCVLREREWKIMTCTGKMDVIRGKGILSMEPVLSRLARAFQYSSRISLTTPSGQMWGSFKMERESGRIFEVKVPPFVLLSDQPPVNSSNIDDLPPTFT
uniref:ApaG domain-containing protein n=1 Tax=Romanomermis culicivorax TaxID=13658 RepID=A0A915IMV2_ROMCU